MCFYISTHFKLQGTDVSVCESGRGQLVVGDYEGNMFFVNRQLQVTSFKAYEIRVSHLFQMKHQNILLSIGVSHFERERERKCFI